MVRRVISQTPITSSEARKLLAEEVDEQTKLDPRLQNLIHSLLRCVAVDPAKASDVVKRLTIDGVPERVAVQLVDSIPQTDGEFLAVIGSDTALLAKKDQILQWIKGLL